jgi:hypothetical protein
MAKMPKQHPEPAASARGSWTAMPIPAPMQRTKLYDAWTVAEACGFRSVRRVPQSCQALCYLLLVRGRWHKGDVASLL